MRSPFQTTIGFLSEICHGNASHINIINVTELPFRNQ